MKNGDFIDSISDFTNKVITFGRQNDEIWGASGDLPLWIFWCFVSLG